ncbi:hypothetical protein [Pseudomonas matsuisoli]|uniref:Uncharacterized protein n=1 Tax=Pseudomonas matsuisoli TaxID=1515666 RepID=A0A917Q239_9PSED|nr:hypothetical protein [Pseudomonas matsuisoli]GGK06794.1 hypothetical protein GCM10009304_36260 [Pseudomonas matsuisoli]
MLDFPYPGFDRFGFESALFPFEVLAHLGHMRAMKIDNEFALSACREGHALFRFCPFANHQTLQTR